MGLDKRLHHARPCSSDIAAVITPATRSDNSARAVFIGQPAKAGRSARVRFLGQAQVRYWIALEAVCAALHDYELRPGSVDVFFNPLPGGVEIRIVRAGHKRNIEFRAARLALASFLGSARTRIQVATVFMDIGKYQIRVFLETVENAIAMMSINIDVGDSIESVLLAQVLDRDAAVIEYAESRSMVTSSMMQASDRYECPFVVAVHDFVDRAQNGTNNGGSGIVNTRDGGCVTIVQPTFTGYRHARHLVDVSRGVEQGQFINQCGTRVPVSE